MFFHALDGEATIASGTFPISFVEEAGLARGLYPFSVEAPIEKCSASTASSYRSRGPVLAFDPWTARLPMTKLAERILKELEGYPNASGESINYRAVLLMRQRRSIARMLERHIRMQANNPSGAFLIMDVTANGSNPRITCVFPALEEVAYDLGFSLQRFNNCIKSLFRPGESTEKIHDALFVLEQVAQAQSAIQYAVEENATASAETLDTLRKQKIALVVAKLKRGTVFGYNDDVVKVCGHHSIPKRAFGVELEFEITEPHDVPAVKSEMPEPEIPATIQCSTCLGVGSFTRSRRHICHSHHNCGNTNCSNNCDADCGEECAEGCDRAGVIETYEERCYSGCDNGVYTLTPEDIAARRHEALRHFRNGVGDRNQIVVHLADALPDGSFIPKNDGSLDFGIELVTAPMEKQALFDWLDKLYAARTEHRLWLASATTAGMHVHINRKQFSGKGHLARFYGLMHGPLGKFIKNYVGRSRGAKLDHWAKKDNNEWRSIQRRGEISGHHYDGVSLDGRETVEVRYFGTTHDPNVAKANVELVESLIEYAADFGACRYPYDKYDVDLDFQKAMVEYRTEMDANASRLKEFLDKHRLARNNRFDKYDGQSSEYWADKYRAEQMKTPKLPVPNASKLAKYDAFAASRYVEWLLTTRRKAYPYLASHIKDHDGFKKLAEEIDTKTKEGLYSVRAAKKAKQAMIRAANAERRAWRREGDAQ